MWWRNARLRIKMLVKQRNYTWMPGVFIFWERANGSEWRREDKELNAWLSRLVLPGWSSRLPPRCPPWWSCSLWCSSLCRRLTRGSTDWMSPTRQRRQRNNKNETSVSIYHLQCSSFLFCQYTAPLVCPLTEADFRHELRNKCRENWIWIFPGACLPHMMNAAGDFVQVRCVQTNRNISQTPCCILTWVHSGIFKKFYSEGGGGDWRKISGLKCMSEKTLMWSGVVKTLSCHTVTITLSQDLISIFYCTLQVPVTPGRLLQSLSVNLTST